jgi:hypothetical protein
MLSACVTIPEGFSSTIYSEAWYTRTKVTGFNFQTLDGSVEQIR